MQVGTAPHITVIGGGILGASVAFHLARGGAKVFVLDSHSGPAEGVTAQSFGWVGLGADTPSKCPESFALRSRALRDFERLEKDCAGRLQKSCRGAIVWKSTPDATRALIEDHRAHGELAGHLVEKRPSRAGSAVDRSSRLRRLGTRRLRDRAQGPRRHAAGRRQRGRGDPSVR